jgi:hypothetical protein
MAVTINSQVQSAGTTTATGSISLSALTVAAVGDKIRLLVQCIVGSFIGGFISISDTQGLTYTAKAVSGVNLTALTLATNPWTGSSGGSVSNGATGFTLNANWGGSTGSILVQFSDGEFRIASVTSASTVVTWTGGLTGSPSTTVYQAPSTIAIVYDAVATATTSNSITITDSSTLLYAALAQDISGLNTSTGFQGASTAWDSNVGSSGANLPGNSITTTGQAFFWGASFDITGPGNGYAAAAGASPIAFSIYATNWTPGYAVTTEYATVNTAGTYAPSFVTTSANQYDNLGMLWVADLLPPPTISVVPSSANYVSNGTSPSTTVYGASLALGNVGIVGVQDKTGNHTLSVSDNLNGTYTKIYSNYNSTLGGVLSFWYVNVRTPGAATVTVAGNVGDSLLIACFGVKGFLGAPAIDVPVEANFSGTSTATVSMTPVSTNYANEILLASNLSTSYITSGFSGWNEFYSGQSQFFYAIEAVASTSNPFSATMAAAANWAGVIAGLYDSGLTFTPGPVPRQIYILP